MPDEIEEMMQHVPSEIGEAVRRFGFAKLAAKVYGVEALDARAVGTIIGEKLAQRIAARRTLRLGLAALREVTR